MVKKEIIKKLKKEINILVEDINDLIKYEKTLHDDKKHTNFVYLENLVVLKDEIMGLNGVTGYLDTLEANNENEISLKEMEDSLSMFIKDRGYPEAVMDLLKRRFDSF